MIEAEATETFDPSWNCTRAGLLATRRREACPPRRWERKLSTVAIAALFPTNEKGGKGMTIWTNPRTPIGSTTMKALAAGLLILTMMIASLLAPSQAQASAFPGANGKIAFASDRTTGTGVNNPEGDFEIFTMNPDGTGLKQLTKNNPADSVARLLC